MKKQQPAAKFEIPPPAHLSERSQALWRELEGKAANTPGRRALFQSALESLDRADQARAVIGIEGLTSKTESTGAIHVHPCARIEREARAQFTKIWIDLQLHHDHHVFTFQ
jgi:phage terminase small subunit